MSGKTNVQLYNLGFSEKSASGIPIGGKGEVAGLFTTKGTKFAKWGDSGESASVVALHEWCAEKGIERTEYVIIDVEGHEPKVLRGMRLDHDSNQRRFPVLQFELGGTWGPRDPRHGGEDEWTQQVAAQHLADHGYMLFLIGKSYWFPVTPEFFAPGPHSHSEGSGPFIQGNLLCVHHKYSRPALREVVVANGNALLLTEPEKQ